MTLGLMLATDRDALLCDLAETYGVFGLHSVPLPLLATLAAGLRDDSRIKLRLAGRSVSTELLLSASAADQLAHLVWMLSDAAAKGASPPAQILPILLGDLPAPQGGFDSPEAYEAARAKIIEGVSI